MANNKMVIFWRWEVLSHRQLITDEVEVENSNNLILRVGERNNKNEFWSFEEILATTTNILQNIDEKDNVCVFIHDGNSRFINPVIKGIDNAKKLPHNFKVFLFGGGKDYIYFKENNTGLLNQFGEFMDSANFDLWNEADKKHKSSKVTVKTNIAGKEQIIANYFDDVWKFYASRPSSHYYEPKIFEFREDLLFYLMPLIHLKEVDLQEFFNDSNIILLKFRMLSFTGISLQGKIKKYLKDEELNRNRSLSFEGLEEFYKNRVGKDIPDLYNTSKLCIKKIIHRLNNQEGTNLFQDGLKKELVEFQIQSKALLNAINREHPVSI